MNKVMKKFLVLLLGLLTSLSALISFGLMGGCADEPEEEQSSQQSEQQSSSQTPQGKPQQPEDVDLTISFSTKEKSLIVGDEEYLSPEYNKVSGFSLSYSSNNPAVVSVDKNGKICAQGEGSATITATYSNGTLSVEASLTVNSSFGGYLPELKTKGVASDISLALTNTYKLLPYIVFNGKQYEDATVSYRVVDNAVAEVDEKGVIVAKAKGLTQLVIEAAWRGKDNSSAPTLRKVINLSVIDDVRFYNAGESIADEVLYTFASFEGKSYKNSIPCDFSVFINGEESQATVVIEDENVVKQHGDKLVVNSFGSTNVTVQATVDGDTYVKSFNVLVERVQKTVLSTVPLFGTEDGEYLDIASGQRKSLLEFVGDNDQMVDAKQGLRSLTLSNNKVLGVESSSLIEIGSASISVGTQKVIYHFTLETLAKAMNSKEDIKALELSNGRVLKGYYELVNDIDASGITLEHVIMGDSSFAGVFNGNGYAIKNLTLNANSSLFGCLDGASATVKNLALINLNATKSYFLAQNTLNDGLVVSNLYIALSEETLTPRGLTGRTAQNSVCENVLIEYLGENASLNRNYQDRWTWQGLIGGLWTVEQDGKLYARDSKWSDVYVISPFVVSFRSDEKKDGESYAALYGYGANETKDIYGNAINGITNNRDNPNLGDYWQSTLYYNAVFTNLYHYASYEDLAAASCDFSSFSGDYWVVYNGKPIWKSLFSEEVEVAFYEGANKVGEEGKIVGLNNEISVKAFVYGEQAQNISVEAEESNLLAWNEESNSLKLIAIPAEGAKRVKATVTVTVGRAQIVKVLTLMVTGEANSYSVTLNPGEGRLNGELTSYECGAGAELPTCSLEGYDFVGWYEDESFSGNAVTSISSTELGDKVYYAKYKVSTSKYHVQVLVAQYGQGYTAGIYTVGGLTYVDRTGEYAELLGLDENGLAEGETNSLADLTKLFAIKGAKINADSILSGTILANGSLELLVKLDFDEEALGFKLANVSLGKYSCENLTFTLEYYNGVCGLGIEGTVGNGKELVIGLDEMTIANYSSVVFNYHEKSANTNSQILALASETVLDNTTEGHVALVGSVSNPANYISASVNIMEKFPAIAKLKQINVKMLGGGSKHLFIEGIETKGFTRQTVTYSIENENILAIATPINGEVSQVGNFTFANTNEGINLNSPALTCQYNGSAVNALHMAGVVLDLGGIKVSDYATIKITFQTIAAGKGTIIYCGGTNVATLYGGAHVVDIKAAAEASGVEVFDKLELSLVSYAAVTEATIYIASIELVLK